MRTIYSGVYRITCLENARFYIGSSKDLVGRKNNHFRDLRQNKHSNPHLQHAWNKYGDAAFLFEVVEECEATREALLTLEQRYIDESKPEFNLCQKAGSRQGSPVSPETREKLSKGLIGHKRTPEEIAKRLATCKALGIKRSPEANAAQAAKMLGRKASPETRQKLSAVRRGRKLSPEHIAKVVAAHLGQKRSPETCAKISEAKRGKPMSSEGREAISVAMNRDDVRAKVSAGKRVAFNEQMRQQDVIKGIDWRPDKQKWRARFQTINLGHFATKEDAIAARLQAQQEYLEHINTA